MFHGFTVVAWHLSYCNSIKAAAILRPQQPQQHCEACTSMRCCSPMQPTSDGVSAGPVAKLQPQHLATAANSAQLALLPLTT